MVVSLCSCGGTDNIEDKNNDGIVYENNDDVIPLGIYSFGEKNSTHYAYYEFTESGNAESSCYWNAELSENGKKKVSEATFKWELEKIGETSYIIHLEDMEDETYTHDIIFNTINDTIVDADYGLTYSKQGETGKGGDDNYLELTKDMIAEIEEKISGSTFPLMICAYFAVAYPLDDYTYTDFEVTSSKKFDDYTYRVYGKLYIKDNYGKTSYVKAYAVYKAVQSNEASTGYEIKWKDVVIDE